MRYLNILTFLLFVLILASCSKERKYEKGFPVSPETQMTDENAIDGIAKDSINPDTRPSGILLTGFPQYRLTTIYKLNYNKKDNLYFIGHNHYYKNYTEAGYTNGNQWNNNFMPGLQAVYGYNMVNVSLYNTETQKARHLFGKPVLIKTLYYPSFSNDSLNYKAIKRNFYMVSVYDEDTNKDGYINLKDLRRFYTFDLDGLNKSLLIPQNYSVISSEYDPANDYMYVLAQIDENVNGQRDDNESIHIFWIDLNDPVHNGRLY